MTQQDIQSHCTVIVHGLKCPAMGPFIQHLAIASGSVALMALLATEAALAVEAAGCDLCDSCQDCKARWSSGGSKKVMGREEERERYVLSTSLEDGKHHAHCDRLFPVHLAAERACKPASSMPYVSFIQPDGADVGPYNVCICTNCRRHCSKPLQLQAI